MSVLEQLLDFNSRKELFFKRHSRNQNQRKDNKCLWRQQGSFSVLAAGWGGQLFNHDVLLWSDGSILTCFQVQQYGIYKRKAGGEHLCVWFNMKVWMWAGWWAPLLHIDLSPLSKKQALQKNKHSKATGTQRGLGPSSNPESPKDNETSDHWPHFPNQTGKREFNLILGDNW